MSTEVATVATAGTAPVATPAPAVAAVPAAAPVAAPSSPPPGEEWRSMSNEQFKQRLAEAGEAQVKKLLKDIGIDDPKAIKAAVDKAKQLEQEKLTETEKLQARLKELEPKATAADTLHGLVDSYAKQEFAALPEPMQKYIAGIAGEDPAARLRAITAARESGVLAAFAQPANPAAPAPKPPAPATTIAPPGPTPPTPTGQPNPQDIYDAHMRAGRDMAAAGVATMHPDIKRGHPDRRPK